MENFEYIKNNLFRYEFISNLVNDKIFDHQKNMSTTYHSAKILLENNSKEILSCNDIKSNKIMSRRTNNEGNIILEIILNIDFSEKSSPQHATKILRASMNVSDLENFMVPDFSMRSPPPSCNRMIAPSPNEHARFFRHQSTELIEIE